MGRQEISPDGGCAADDRTRSGALLQRDGLLCARQRHLWHPAVLDAVPGRIPLLRAALDHAAVHGRESRAEDARSCEVALDIIASCPPLKRNRRPGSKASSPPPPPSVTSRATGGCWRTTATTFTIWRKGRLSRRCVTSSGMDACRPGANWAI